MKTPLKQLICSLTGKAGAVRTRFARAGAVSPDADAQLRNWVERGHHAAMDWLERHASLRADTESVLPGARTVISTAFSYYPSRQRLASLPSIAMYAYGRDYHMVLRRRLTPAAELLRNEGYEARICIDSAPVSERYWAAASGVGERGLNGSILVPGSGSYVVLAEILTTAEIEPDAKLNAKLCSGCGKCVNACPTKALLADGTLDSSRCLNYLTIEKRGEFTEKERHLLSGAPPTLFGCDICQRVCPQNASVRPTDIEEFQASEQMLSLTAAEMLSLSHADLIRLFPGSPLKRAGIEGLHRNAAEILRLRNEP